MSIERTIVLPVQDNQGKGMAQDIDGILAEILKVAGGFSQVEQTGVWLDETTGTIFRDRSLRIVTTVDDVTDAYIASRLQDWCYLLRQEALYTHTVEVHASFVLPVSKKTQPLYGMYDVVTVDDDFLETVGTVYHDNLAI